MEPPPTPKVRTVGDEYGCAGLTGRPSRASSYPRCVPRICDRLRCRVLSVGRRSEGTDSLYGQDGRPYHSSQARDLAEGRAAQYAMLEEILNSTWPAVSAADPDAGGVGVPGKPFQAHAIISNPVTYGHVHVAERLGVPLHIMFPQPWTPTQAFPHPLSNLAYDNQPSKKNYMSYRMVDLLMWQCTEGMVNEFGCNVLGLRKIRKGDGGRDILLDLYIPHAFMWSPALVSKPADWGRIYDVIGTVTLKEEASNYEPTHELESFLGTDGGPIFVGFGSMVIDNPQKSPR